MRSKILTLAALSFMSFNLLAAQSIYCPLHQRYVNVGMTVADVVAACGEPVNKLDSDRPNIQRIPVKRLIYIELNKGSVYSGLNSTYDMWSIPSGSKGVSLEVDIINNRVTAVNINGGGNNTMDICQNGNVSIGNTEAQVNAACGSPDMVNNTYIDQAIPSKNPPQIWIYQVNQYQPPFSLTFVDGKLQSIN